MTVTPTPNLRLNVNTLSLNTSRSQFLVSNSGMVPCTVALNNGNFILMTMHNNIIIGTIYNGNDASQMSAFIIENNSNQKSYWLGYDFNRVMSSYPSGGLVVVWSEYVNNHWNIFANNFDNLGQTNSVPHIINDNTGNDNRGPTVATLSDNTFVVGWIQEQESQNVIIRIMNKDLTFSSSQILLDIGSSPTISSLKNNIFIVGYETTSGIDAKIFNDNVLIDTLSIASPGIQPDITTHSTGFASCWQINGDGSDQGIQCKTYNVRTNPVTITALSPVFWVNNYISGNQAEPSVLEVAPGILSVIYHSDYQSVDGHASIECVFIDVQGNKSGDYEISQFNGMDKHYPIFSVFNNYIFAAYSTAQLGTESYLYAALSTINGIISPSPSSSVTSSTALSSSTTSSTFLIVASSQTTSYSPSTTISLTSSQTPTHHEGSVSTASSSVSEALSTVDIITKVVVPVIVGAVAVIGAGVTLREHIRKYCCGVDEAQEAQAKIVGTAAGTAAAVAVQKTLEAKEAIEEMRTSAGAMLSNPSAPVAASSVVLGALSTAHAWVVESLGLDDEPESIDDLLMTDNLEHCLAGCDNNENDICDA